jgi:hypothetical protein
MAAAAAGSSSRQQQQQQQQPNLFNNKLVTCVAKTALVNSL